MLRKSCSSFAALSGSRLLLACVASACVGMAGCGGVQGGGAGSTVVAAAGVRGTLRGGQQPVTGATVTLYAAGTSGDGATAQVLFTTSTDGTGSFQLPASLGCSAGTSELYITGVGGNPGMSSNNGGIGLMAALGPCSAVPVIPFININEVTTVAAVAALYPYMASPAQYTPAYAAIGSDTSDLTAFQAAFTTAGQYASVPAGTAPGNVPNGYYASSTEIDTLADILSACINSGGGTSGDGTSCGKLFLWGKNSGGTAATETITAAMNLLNNPNENVSLLFGLVPSSPPFVPTNSTAPSGWTFPILLIPAAPGFSLAGGSYSGTQTLTMTETTTGAAVYYTLDGTTPTTASNLYTGPLSISVSETVTAVAVNGGRAYSGSTTSASYTIAPDFSFTASPQSVPLAASSSEEFGLSATALHGLTGNVTVTLSGLPTGVTADHASYTVLPGEVTQVTLTAASSSHFTAGVYAVTATAVSGTLTHTSQVEVTLGTANDYALNDSNVAVSLVANGSQTMSVSASAVNTYSGAVAVQVTGLPTGVTASPSSFSVTVGGAAQTVTLTAASGVPAGNTVAQLVSTSGAITHDVPLEVNVGAQTQDFVIASPAAVSLPASTSGTVTMDIVIGAIGGFENAVNVSIAGLPAHVSVSPSSFTLSASPAGTDYQSVSFTSGSTTAFANTTFSITATSGSLTHVNPVLLTTVPNGTVAATVSTTPVATPFGNAFVGLSMPSSTVQEFAGTGSTTYQSFVNLLDNLEQYVGPISFRSTLPTTSTYLNEIVHLSGATDANFTTPWASPQFFLTTSSSYTLATDATYVQTLISDVGTSNVLGFEVDNEPDSYVSNGYRSSNWTYADYLSETASYQQAFAPYLTAPQLMATAEAGNSWEVGLPALLAQESGQLSTVTAHYYPLSACSGTPTIANLLADKSSRHFYARYAGLVQSTSVPVRAGEMNSVACSGYAGVSNAFAASLWAVDAAFEVKGAGAAGFNLHSGGTTSGAQPYDIGFNSGGSTSVYAPFYGLLFFSQAIQNGARPLPVTMTQTSGNVKVWATIDAANVVRVVVLEKDTDGTGNTKTVSLTLPGMTAAGTMTTMTAAAVTATSGITIAGQTFDGTTNGLLTGTASSTTVTPVGNVYTVTVADGTAAMLTIP